MTDNKNTILAIALSALVLIAWQYFYGIPHEKARQEQLQQQQAKQTAQTQTAQPAGQPTQSSTTQPQAPGTTPQIPGAVQTAAPASIPRAEALSASPRVAIDTPSLKGSIALKGGRLDDLALVKYHETVDNNSPPIFLLSPTGTADPFYAEFGWAPSGNVKVPGADAVWKQDGTGALSPTHPVTLSWDNGEGLIFRRVISVDDKYMFNVRQEVVNNGSSPVTLHPYGLISRHGTPQTMGYYILHEGLVGDLGGPAGQQVTDHFPPAECTGIPRRMLQG